MLIRGSIFDSMAERKAFVAIAQRWSDRALLAYGVPLRKILTTEEQDALEPNVERFLNDPRTSVDYTFAEPKTGRPLLSVEFDGLGYGHNRGAAYVGLPTPIDRNRHWKLETKLQLARAARFPFLVVSYEETEPVDATGDLTILDAILGRFFARRALMSTLLELIHEKRDELDDTCGSEHEEYLQDLFLQAEVLAEVREDPLVTKTWEYRRACEAAAPCSSQTRLDESGLPQLGHAWPPINALLFDRIRAVEGAETLGATVEILTPEAPIVRTVRVRNFGPWLGPDAVSVARSLAEYQAWRDAHALLCGDGAAGEVAR